MRSCCLSTESPRESCAGLGDTSARDAAQNWDGGGTGSVPVTARIEHRALGELLAPSMSRGGTGGHRGVPAAPARRSLLERCGFPAAQPEKGPASGIPSLQAGCGGRGAPPGALAGILGGRVAQGPVGRGSDTRGPRPRTRAQLGAFPARLRAQRLERKREAAAGREISRRR